MCSYSFNKISDSMMFIYGDQQKDGKRCICLYQNGVTLVEINIEYFTGKNSKCNKL